MYNRLIDDFCKLYEKYKNKGLLPSGDMIRDRHGKMGLSEIYFIDSTTIPVCHNKLQYRNKVFENLAASGKTSMGYFHGFKLHVVINETSLQITKANIYADS